jgi:hypothetical protein
VSLNFDEVGVLQNRLTKRPSRFAGVYRGPFGQIDEGLAVEHQRGNFVRVQGVAFQPHACEGEPDGLAADGSLWVISRHPGPIDTMLAGGVNLKGCPGSHSDFGIENMLGRAVGVYGESGLQRKGRVISQRTAADGSHQGGRLASPRRNLHRAESLTEFV